MKLPRIVFLRADLKPVVAELKVIADALAVICRHSYNVNLREVKLSDDTPKEEPTVSYHNEEEALAEEMQEQKIDTAEAMESYLRGKVDVTFGPGEESDAGKDKA